MSAKDIILRPISAQDANAIVRRVHYSGKVVNNSQLHIGVFYQGRLEGVCLYFPRVTPAAGRGARRWIVSSPVHSPCKGQRARRCRDARS